MKDSRYKAIKSLIETNGLERFRDIFTIVPISTVKADLKVNYSTLRRRIHNIDLLTMKDIKGMANLFEVDPKSLFAIIIRETKTNPSRRSK